MAYSKFSLKTVKETFGITLIEDQSLFDLSQIPSVTISPYLELTLAEGTSMALAINTEKSRSEWIIAPILTEVRKQVHAQISLFSGRSFTVDRKRGLYGQCDYLLSLSPEQLYIAAPAIAVVEAKKEDIVAGLGQCIATMYAAWLFNERENRPLPWIYGAVTTGTTWKFLKLRDRMVYIDQDEYYFKEIQTILGIFQVILTTIDHPQE